MTLSEQYVNDAIWMVQELGEPVTFHGDSSVTVIAIIDRQAEDPPAYGYTSTLSNKHHQITFILGDLPRLPKNGDQVEFDSKLHTIDYVNPPTDVVTVNAK